MVDPHRGSTMSALSIESLTAAIKAPAQDRTERFMARVRDHIRTLPDDAARIAFVSNQVARWIDLYQAWAFRIDTGTADELDLRQDASDYVCTIADLRKLRDDLKATVAA
jgi:hypothetical protein